MASEAWLVTGASGQLGGHLLRRLASDPRAGRVLALAGEGDVAAGPADVARVDLRDHDALRASVAAFRPTFILHVGAMTSVADAYRQPDDAGRINAGATAALAEAAASCGARLVFSSTDMVFDGRDAPYAETAAIHPPSVYGRTKAEAERLLAGYDRALVVRIPLMYGRPCTDRQNTFVQQVAALREGRPLRLFHDEYRTPVWVVDAARALIALACSGLCDRRTGRHRDGLIHLAGPERLSRYEMVARFARMLGIVDPRLEPVSRLTLDAAEPRPADLSLRGERFERLFPEFAPRPIPGEFDGWRE